jgi:hypothetical protein
MAQTLEEQVALRKIERKKTGRPKKALVESKKKKRSPGDAATIREYKARLLASPKSRRVMDSILNAALDDEHKNQAAAWKLVVDRIMPLSYFDEAKNTGGKASVNITITGVGGDIQTIGDNDKDSPLIDIPYTDYEVDE